MTSNKTWFITGTSRGFGREWAIAALDRGDRVAGTARDLDDISDLAERYGDSFLPIELDVTDRAADFAAVKEAHDRLGRLDVVVNNAGFGQFGMVEELSEDDFRGQIETNLFGAVWVTQAALPILREQGSGHIIQVSSIGGILAFPGIGAYHASKWALEGVSTSLSKEVADFGIKVTLIEPGGFSTDWAGDSANESERMDAYAAAHEAGDEVRDADNEGDKGDPEGTRAAILEIVDADDPPLHALFGKGTVDMVAEDYENRLKVWREWEPVAVRAAG